MLDAEVAAILASETLAEQVAQVGDKHFTEWVPVVKELKRASRWHEAELLLVQLARAADEWGRVTGHGTPPWYADQLRIVRKKGSINGCVREVLDGGQTRLR